MIALLRGRVARAAEDHAVLDVGGVGYLVQASSRTLRALPRVGEPAELLTEMQVTDEAIRLFGFADEAERTTFRVLQTVQGVGSRVALSILGALGPEGVAAAVAAGDRGALSRAPGVGPRLATRLATELKERLRELPGGARAAILPPPLPEGLASPAPGAPALAGPEEDAVAALARLGFARVEAVAALGRARARLGEGAALGALLRESLKELSRPEVAR